MTTIQRTLDSIRTHLPAFLRRDTTPEQEQQQAVAGTTSHG